MTTLSASISTIPCWGGSGLDVDAVADHEDLSAVGLHGQRLDLDPPLAALEDRRDPLRAGQDDRTGAFILDPVRAGQDPRGPGGAVGQGEKLAGHGVDRCVVGGPQGDRVRGQRRDLGHGLLVAVGHRLGREVVGEPSGGRAPERLGLADLGIGLRRGRVGRSERQEARRRLRQARRFQGRQLARPGLDRCGLGRRPGGGFLDPRRLRRLDWPGSGLSVRERPREDRVAARGAGQLGPAVGHPGVEQHLVERDQVSPDLGVGPAGAAGIADVPLGIDLDPVERAVSPTRVLDPGDGPVGDQRDISLGDLGLIFEVAQ